MSPKQAFNVNRLTIFISVKHIYFHLHAKQLDDISQNSAIIIRDPGGQIGVE